MELRQRAQNGRLPIKTKIVATVGPACGKREQLRELIVAGVNLFRLNFAHGDHNWLKDVVDSIRQVATELGRPIGILGDLCGPKIRLGELPEEGIYCADGEQFEFVHDADPSNPRHLTCTYESLIDDLRVGDRVLLSDGTVAMRVVDCRAGEGRVICEVEQSGRIRSRQGVNLPGAKLSTPSLTAKDREDLTWAIEHELDFIGLSFVRSADDVRLLRALIDMHSTKHRPQIVAKIEKLEAVSDLERILDETNAVMVARGDLGVEADIAQVPVLQKRIIRLCNQHRIPVITATQMLDSMTHSEMPTRAETSDVANAVLDGSDAVMLSQETAVGDHPVKTVRMMGRIISEVEPLLPPHPSVDSESHARNRATIITESVTLGAGVAAQHLAADLIVVATHGGKTAMSVSKQRNSMPILAVTDNIRTARRMSLYWGVTPVKTDAVNFPPNEFIKFVVEWGQKNNLLSSGSRVVAVASTDWSLDAHDMLLVHVVP